MNASTRQIIAAALNGAEAFIRDHLDTVTASHASQTPPYRLDADGQRAARPLRSVLRRIGRAREALAEVRAWGTE